LTLVFVYMTYDAQPWFCTTLILYNLDFVMYTALLRIRKVVTIYRMIFEQANGTSSSIPCRIILRNLITTSTVKSYRILWFYYRRRIKKTRKRLIDNQFRNIAIAVRKDNRVLLKASNVFGEPALSHERVRKW